MTSDVLQWIGIATAFLTMGIGLLKVKPETRKMKQDGTAAVINAAGAVIGHNSTSYAALVARVAVLETRQDDTDARLERHRPWDETVARQARAAGLEIPDPPPLFGDDERKAG